MIVEGEELGGTCVNLGCVPKKILFHAANLRQEILRDAMDYGMEVQGEVAMDWGKLLARLDAYIKRLRVIYDSHLAKEGVTVVKGRATFTGNKQVIMILQITVYRFILKSGHLRLLYYTDISCALMLASIVI